MRAEAAWLDRAWREARRPVVITGAGISVASGLAPFRGSQDAVWSKTAQEMGTLRMFESDPVRQWGWYLDRFDVAFDAEPNAAHHALATLGRRVAENGGQMAIVTQNIDGLHIKAGSDDVIEAHGAVRYLRCSGAGCTNSAPDGTLPWQRELFDRFRASRAREHLPTCSACGKLLRPHVLWFDERYAGHSAYRIGEVARWLDEADLLVFIGTSFSVGLTESAMFKADLRALPTWSIDPHSAPVAGHVFWLQTAAEDVLPALSFARGEGP